ncbi:MAG TPA: alpha/beta hydrolase [Solirubrobacteraceae bacterium]|jgi:pimeloyl-ACP methyl ester carboxylesterase|nr:alpha/beta hydrolase [Solirubrobacteraceae bacterium]
MPLAEINGEQLYYEDSGGDGPAILFSHGAFMDHSMWAPQVGALSPTYRCVTWDERGCGMSTASKSFTYWDSAADAIGLLNELEITHAVLVGMSQGGWLTQRAALSAPDRVRGLILQGTSVKLLSEEETTGYTQLSTAWMAMGPVGEIADAVAGIQFSATGYDASGYVAKWQGRPPGDWKEVWNAILGGRDEIEGRLGEISCPVQFVHGTADMAFPVSVAHEMSALVPSSRGVVEIEGGPHALSLTHPDQLTSAIRGFLQSL